MMRLSCLLIRQLPVNDLSPLIKLPVSQASLLPLARCLKLKQLECFEYALDLDEMKPDLWITFT